MTVKDIDTSLVTVGQPTDGGCVWTSFATNPALPTSAAETLAAGVFESLGDLSENGFTEGKNIEVTKHKGWHGDVVSSSVSGDENTFKLDFIEVNRASVAKLRYGADSVTSNASDGSVASIAVGAYKGVTVPLVIDELESCGYKRRTVVPRASVESIDDVAHQRGSLLVYGASFTALKDDDGKAFYVYRAAPAAQGE